MVEHSKSTKLTSFLGILVCLSGGNVWGQLDVIEESGPYSYHVFGPNNHGDVGGYGPAGGSDGANGYFIWYRDGTTSATAPLVPVHINDNGVTAGVVYPGAPYWQPHAAIRLNGEVIDLHLLLGLPVESGSNSHVTGLNSTGMVAISAWSFAGRAAYLWSEPDGVTDIDLPDNAHAPEAMNELGEVIGQCSYTEPDRWCAYFWSPVTGYEEIFSSNWYVYPIAINDRSEAVGYAFERDPSDGTLTSKQFYWKAGGDAQIFASGLGQVMAINNSGTVMGWEADRDFGAYLWRADIGFLERNLMLPGSRTTRRLQLNDLDFVAGTASQYGGNRNFLWTPTYGYQVFDTELVGDIEGMKGLFAVAEGFTRYEIVLPPQTPVEILTDLIEYIASLVGEGVIDSGEQASLTSKLHSAIALFSDDRTTPACNLLNAFINEVEAKIQSGSIDPDTGAALITPINTIEACSDS